MSQRDLFEPTLLFNTLPTVVNYRFGGKNTHGMEYVQFFTWLYSPGIDRLFPQNLSRPIEAKFELKLRNCIKKSYTVSINNVEIFLEVIQKLKRRITVYIKIVSKILDKGTRVFQNGSLGMGFYLLFQ